VDGRRASSLPPLEPEAGDRTDEPGRTQDDPGSRLWTTAFSHPLRSHTVGPRFKSKRRLPAPTGQDPPLGLRQVESPRPTGVLAGVSLGFGALSRQIDRVRSGAAINMMAKATTTMSRASGMPVTMTMLLAPVVSAL